jgi:plastocyanin
MFRPAQLVVAPGTTIVWTNRGQVIHTVTAEDGSFDSGAIENGRRSALLFAKPGTFPFHCTPHPFMRGEVIVR